MTTDAMKSDVRLGDNGAALSEMFVHHYTHLRAHLQAIEIVKAHPSRGEPMVKLQLEALYDMAIESLDALKACASSPTEALWCHNAKEFRNELCATRDLARIDRLAPIATKS